jgi:hypothetical protein
MLVQREISHQSLQPPILVLQLSHPPQLAHAQVGELLPPGVERGLADADLPADIADGGARLDLPEGVGDLLFRKPGLLQGPLLVGDGPQNLPVSPVTACRTFRGRRQLACFTSAALVTRQTAYCNLRAGLL